MDLELKQLYPALALDGYRYGKGLASQKGGDPPAAFANQRIAGRDGVNQDQIGMRTSFLRLKLKLCVLDEPRSPAPYRYFEGLVLDDAKGAKVTERALSTTVSFLGDMVFQVEGQGQ